MVDRGVEQALVEAPPAAWVALRTLLAFLPRLLVTLNLGRASTRKMDTEMMTDHIKRDIGLVDGLEPHYGDGRLR